MKELIKPIFVICFTFFFISCKEESVQISQSYAERINNLDELSASFAKLTANYSKHKKRLSDLNSIQTKSNTQSLNSNIEIKSFVNKSKRIYEFLGVKEREIKDVAKEYTDDVYLILGISLVYKHNSDNILKTKGNVGNIKDCLMEAVGLDVLVSLGDMAYTLYKGEVAAGMAVDAVAAAAFKKAALKAAKKIALRALGGLGAVVAIVKFTDCITTDDTCTITEPYYRETNLTCDDLVRATNKLKDNNFRNIEFYHLLKTDINYTSDNSYTINPSKNYQIYFIDFKDTGECGTIFKSIETISGSEIGNISEIFSKEDIINRIQNGE